MISKRWPFIRRPNILGPNQHLEKGDPRLKARRKNDIYEVLSIVPLIVFLLDNPKIKKHNPLSLWQKVRLCWIMYDNTKMIRTGTSYKAHLAMAIKLLEMPRSEEGVVVECGCWKGGATVNLSLVCAITDRKLIVYDSFEGLPDPMPGDQYAKASAKGIYRGALEEVADNVRRLGDIDRCEFRKGWFSDTIPHHNEPIALAFLDVDYQASLHDCVVGLWPHLIEKGYVFLDEYSRLDYCGIFYSEKYWRKYFDRTPPGIMGTGTGVGVGQLFLGPLKERTPLERPASLAFTRKDFDGYWDYYPDEISEDAPVGGKL